MGRMLTHCTKIGHERDALRLQIVRITPILRLAAIA